MHQAREVDYEIYCNDTSRLGSNLNTEVVMSRHVRQMNQCYNMTMTDVHTSLRLLLTIKSSPIRYRRSDKEVGRRVGGSEGRRLEETVTHIPTYIHNTLNPRPEIIRTYVHKTRNKMDDKKQSNV